MEKAKSSIIKALSDNGLRPVSILLDRKKPRMILKQDCIYLVQRGDLYVFASNKADQKQANEFTFGIWSEDQFILAPKNADCQISIWPRSDYASIKQYSKRDIAKVVLKEPSKDPVNRALVSSIIKINEGLSLLVTGHHRSHYLHTKRKTHLIGGETYTSDKNNLWCYIQEKKLMFLDVVNFEKETLYLPMVDDIFFRAHEDCQIDIVEEDQVLSSPQARAILVSTMSHLLSAVPGALQRRIADQQAVDHEILETRQSHFGLALDTFKSLIKRRKLTIDVNPQATEMSCCTFKILNYIGLKGVESFIASVESCELKTVDDVSVHLGLRHRSLPLNGMWWKKDLGPFISFYGPDKQPVALIPNPLGGYQMFRKKDNDPIASILEESELVDPKIAAEIHRDAFILYPKFDDNTLSFGSIVNFCFKSSAKDFYTFLGTSFITGFVSLMLPFLSAHVINIAVPDQDYALLLQIASMLICIHLANVLVQYTTDRAMLRVNGKVGVFVQAAVIDRILRFSLHEHAKNPHAMTSIKVGMLDGVRRGIMGVIGSGIPTLIFLGYAAGLIYYYSPMAAAIASALMLMILLIACLLAFAQFKAFFDGKAMVTNSLATVVQAIESIRGLRTLGLEKNMFRRWSQGFNQLKMKMYRSKYFDNIYKSIMASMQLIFTGLLYLAISGMEIDSSNIGIFMAFTSSSSLFYNFGTQFIGSIYSLLQQAPMFKIAQPILKTKPQTIHKINMEHQYKGNIEMKGVFFRYPDGKDMVFRNVNSQITYGDLVVITGDIGSGKSSLLKCMTGLVPATMGSIFYDEVEIKKLNQQKLFEKIGYVNQWNYLLGGTILDNIQGEHKYELSKIWEMIDLLGLSGTMNRLPLGVSTMINPENPPLSTSEIQKILIARELAGNPRFVFLDDGTRFLGKKERLFLEEYLLNQTSTKIIVSHSRDTLERADKILFMHDQAVTEKNSLKELEDDPKLGPVFDKFAA